MKTNRNIHQLMAIGLCLTVMPAVAAGFEKTIPAKDLKECQVVTRSGDVKIVGWDQPQVKVASKDGQVGIKLSSGRLKLGLEGMSSSNESADRDMTVHIPRHVELEITTISGDVDVGGMRNRLEVHAVSGDLHLDDCQGRVRIKTVSGQIQADGLQGELKLVTVSGSVHLKHFKAERLEAKSVSGDVVIEGMGKHMELKSHSGEVTFAGSLAEGAEVAVKTFSGNGSIRLPANAGFEVRAKSRSGSVSVEHAIQVEEKSEHEVVGRLGDKGAEIVLKSFSGDLSIRKSK